MNGYDEFVKAQEQYTANADASFEKVGGAVHWFFLLIGAAISAGASYYIGHQGMDGNPFYDRFIGARNAAFLVVVALDGTFLALVWGTGTFLKTQAQRALAARALWIVKAILCLNIICAFLMIQAAAVVPLVKLYTVYGSPVVISGVIWLWSELYAQRRKGVNMASALDTIAQRDALWRAQFLLDEQASREAYQVAAKSPAVAAMRTEAARRKVVRDLAAELSITETEAEAMFTQAQAAHRAAHRPAPAPPAPPALPYSVTYPPGNGRDWTQGEPRGKA